MLVHSWTGELNKFFVSPKPVRNLVHNKGVPQLAGPRVAFLIMLLTTTHYRFIPYTAYQKKLRMVPRIKNFLKKEKKKLAVLNENVGK